MKPSSRGVLYRHHNWSSHQVRSINRGLLLAATLAGAIAAHAQDGRSLQTAIPLGTLPPPNSPAVRTGWLNAGTPRAYYQFTIDDSVQEVILSLSELTNGVTIALARDANSDGLEEVLASRPGSRGNTSTTTLWLAPGTYYARAELSSPAAPSTYRLALSQSARPDSPGDTDNSPDGARPIAAGAARTEFVGENDSRDYFRFEVTDTVTEMSISLAGRSVYGGSPPGPPPTLVYNILADVDRDGTPESIASGLSVFGNTAAIALWLDPGVYYVRVDQPTGSGNERNAFYELALSATPRPESPGRNDNTLDSARFWVPGVTVTDFVGNNDVVDYFRFDVESAGYVTAVIPAESLTPQTSIQPFRLNLAFLGGAQQIASANGDSYVGAALTNLLAPGSYLVRVRRLTEFDNTTYTLALGGVATPKASVVALSGDLDFGELLAGNSAARFLTIRNTGTVNLRVNGIHYPPGFSGDFSGAIAAGGEQQVAVTFSPAQAGPYGGTVQILSDATIGSGKISVTGRGLPVPTRVLEFTPVLDFGSVELTRPGNRILALRNTGNTNLHVTGLTTPPGFQAEFAGTIPPRGTQMVPITFSPSETGAVSNVLVIHSDATSISNQVVLLAQVTPIRPRVLSLGGDLNFGSVETFRAATRTLFLTNTGEATFEVTSLALPAGFSGAFSGPIEPGRSRSTSITFAPTLAQHYSGVVTALGDFNGGSSTLDVSGDGTRPLRRIISINDLSFGGIPVRTRVTQTLTISNLGEAPLVVTNLVLPPGFAGAFSGTIAPGSAQTVALTFQPVEVRDYSARLLVLADSNGGSSSAQLSGQGLPAALQPVSGSYAGLFHQQDGVRHGVSGSIAWAIGTKRNPAAYSLSLNFPGEKLGGSGTFAFDGLATNIFMSKRLGRLTLICRTDPTQPGTVTGTLDSAAWHCVFIASQTPFNGSLPTPLAGRYTLIFPGSADSPDSPEGDGALAVTVSAAGIATVTGTLADGRKVASAHPLTAEGDCPYFFAAPDTSVLGWIHLAAINEPAVSGVISWNRLPVPKGNVPYAAGFSVDLECQGFRYSPPARDSAGVNGYNHGTIVLSSLRLPNSIESPFQFRSATSVMGTGTNQITLQLNRETGLYSGTVRTRSGRNLVTLKYQGVLNQPNGSPPYGTGFFLWENASGRARIELEP